MDVRERPPLGTMCWRVADTESSAHPNPLELNEIESDFEIAWKNALTCCHSAPSLLTQISDGLTLTGGSAKKSYGFRARKPPMQTK